MAKFNYNFNEVNDYIADVERGLIAPPSEAKKERMLQKAFKAVENGLASWLHYASIQQLPTGDYSSHQDGGFIVPPKA